MFDYPRFDLDQDPPECTGQGHLFFPQSPHPLSVEEARAKAICARCPYRAPCLDYATRHGEKGIWGGTTENERIDKRRTDDQPKTATPRLSRYTLYEVTQMLISRDGLTVRECAARLGLTYSHVAATRRQVNREIELGQWRPTIGGDS